jgi:hypothetical protein
MAFSLWRKWMATIYDQALNDFPNELETNRKSIRRFPLQWRRKSRKSSSAQKSNIFFCKFIQKKKRKTFIYKTANLKYAHFQLKSDLEGEK